MKVKVSPPFEGAGSFVVEVESVTSFSTYILKDGAGIPASWCEKIPEVVPEPGDIVEVWDFDDEKPLLRVFTWMNGELFRASFWAEYPIPDYSYAHCRVLARKPRKLDAIRTELGQFVMDWKDVRRVREEDAYADLVSAILGGAKMGRVE